MRRDKKLRGRLSAYLLIFAAVFLTGICARGAQKKSEALNVLLISIDTLRPDRLSCYDSQFVETPNIDSLASRSVVFDRAFAHNPTTLPSHTNILLGTTPLYHGVHDNAQFKLAGEFVTLSEYLKDRGYATGAFIGAFPLDSRFGLAQGFDVYDESYPSGSLTDFAAPERRADEVIQAAVDWIDGQESIWFSFVHLWDPHTPYSPPEPFLSQYKDDPYSGEAAYVDFQLGKLFDFLDRKRLMSNTLIVLTGDHGESLGEHGELTHNYFAYNSTVWIPLIISAPGIQAGRTADYACHADIFATVCDILQIDSPPFLQGISLVPAMNGKKIKTRAIYIESLDPYYNRGAAPLRGFIEEGEKFLDSPIPEYYDLESDFQEEINKTSDIDVDRYRKKLNGLIENLATSQAASASSRLDEETMRRLRSLGYISSAQPRVKESYGPADDLKTILPYQQKLDAAVIMFDKGKRDESIRLLEEIIQEKKDMVRAYIYLFPMYQTQNQPAKALALLEQGYEHNPENYDIATAYGMLLSESGLINKGITVLQKALAMIDFDPKVWDLLGVAYWRKGDEPKALEYYQKALALDPDSAKTHSNLGALYFARSMKTQDRTDFGQAMEYFKKAIEYDPSLVVAYRGLGLGYKAVGRASDAITVWEQGLAVDPTDSFIHLHLGKAHLERGDKNRALEYFENYLKLRGDSLSAQERGEIEALIQKCRQK
jgi:arylsulfatase A-like enzyme/Tfp pilus assembly protein PilF